jgi:ATP-dependent DNA ligase
VGLKYQGDVFFKYIQPCSPILAKSVPVGDDWQREVKFDGFRVQAHIIGKTVELYSRNGSKFSRRFPRLVNVLGELPTRSAIIDGEIVASGAAGMPDFWPLFLRSAKPAELHVWAFDLLALDGKDLRKLPLERRQARLQVLLRWFACPTVLASEVLRRRPGAAPGGREARAGGRGEQASGCPLQVRCLSRVAQG